MWVGVDVHIVFVYVGIDMHVYRKNTMINALLLLGG